MRYLLLIFFSFNCLAQADLLYKANSFYDQGNYLEATKIYLELVEKNKENGELFFNLGNIYFRSNELGKSIFYYKKAYELLPRDGDTKYNLEYARKKAIDKIEVNKSWTDWITFTKIFSVNEEFYLLFFISFIFWPLLLLNLYKRSDWVRWSKNLVMLTFILSGVIVVKDYFFMKKFGVVIAKEVSIYSATGKDNVVLFTLHEGCEFFYSATVGTDWVQIELADGKRGWAKREQIII